MFQLGGMYKETVLRAFLNDYVISEELNISGINDGTSFTFDECCVTWAIKMLAEEIDLCTREVHALNDLIPL
jgi:hypothetical protein